MRVTSSRYQNRFQRIYQFLHVFTVNVSSSEFVKSFLNLTSFNMKGQIKLEYKEHCLVNSDLTYIHVFQEGSENRSQRSNSKYTYFIPEIPLVLVPLQSAHLKLMVRHHTPTKRMCVYAKICLEIFPFLGCHPAQMFSYLFGLDRKTVNGHSHRHYHGHDYHWVLPFSLKELFFCRRLRYNFHSLKNYNG